MKIDRALLLHLEALARLELGEAERAAMAADLTRILDYAESLSLPAAGAAPPPVPAAGPLREDAVAPSLAASALGALAPRWEAGHFLVPPVLGGPAPAAGGDAEPTPGGDAEPVSGGDAKPVSGGDE